MVSEEFVICSDFDDVMNNLVPCWISWLNAKHNLDVRYEDVTDWDIMKVYPTLTSDQVFEPLHNESFWDTVTAKPDAQEYIPKLIEDGFKFKVVTSSFYRLLGPKFDRCLFKHFPYLTKKDVIITYDKQMIACDMMIDDGPFNLKDGNYIRVLFDTPHNRTEQHVAHFIVDNWKDIYQLANELRNTRYP